ncbi:hypothetical protein G4X40_03320 [Rhodococcus sp. D2-41]|uniref:Uncharacterized protein n=1 Tax=Speluncibacter jeojiensis TaxID=2710754 RepID=A0A9X4M2S9_9ACTN|nr:hypothetical protein [Rhodococcus sp. D2-41]MDG3009176.1 hypothetical protein [Rhodococcus sp. D2-41]MDG3016151.1 hypothetical protein [Corynebacteriales bacterium D3-21]
MGLFELITLPLRAGIAYTQASIGVARLVAPGGPIRVVYRLADLTDEDRPLGQALAPGGTLDRLLAEGDVLVQLTAVLGPLDRALKPGGPLERLLAEDGLLDQLVAEGGVLDRLVDVSGALAQLTPSLDLLDEPIRQLDHATGALTAAVAPLTVAAESLRDLASRVPGMPPIPGFGRRDRG